MTKNQALKQAQKRWGKLALIRDSGPRKKPPEKKAVSGRYDVGKHMNVCGLSFFEVKGWGETWEEAFAHADQRARKDKERYARMRQEAK